MPEKGPLKNQPKNRFTAFLLRLIPTERQRILALTVISGALCGLAAVAFHLGILKVESLVLDRALYARGRTWIFWTILSPTAAGLAAGLLLKYWVPGAVGSGVTQVKLSYAQASGWIPLRDTIGKFVIGILQIGSGASLGPEGPTVHIGAGIASWIGRVANVSRANQRRMLSVGVAAGLAAAFNAPIAAVTFTLEEIIGDLDQTMLSGVIVAAAIAAVTARGILGRNPVLQIRQIYTLSSPRSLISYAVLGVLTAVASIIFTDLLLALRERFKTFTDVPKWMHPAVGGALTGMLAVVAMLWLKQPGIAGQGYQTLEAALSGSLGIRVLLGLFALKLLATVCSYSSGGVGGLFAPSLFIGGMLGGAIGYLDVMIFHTSTESIGAFALVGMGAMFAGTIRAPMTSVLLIFELTAGYGLILPLMIANMIAYGLARRWRRTSIFEALLIQDGVVLPHGKAVTATAPAEVGGEVVP